MTTTGALLWRVDCLMLVIYIYRSIYTTAAFLCVQLMVHYPPDPSTYCCISKTHRRVGTRALCGIEEDAGAQLTEAERAVNEVCMCDTFWRLFLSSERGVHVHMYTLILLSFVYVWVARPQIPMDRFFLSFRSHMEPSITIQYFKKKQNTHTHIYTYTHRKWSRR